MNEKTVVTAPPFNLKRIYSKFCVIISRSAFIPSSVRIRILRSAGVKIGRGCFIGSNVFFDEMRPDLIELGYQVTVTSGTRILTHFFNPTPQRYMYGKVTIGSRVFIGMNTLIVNAVDIGDRAVVAAGSVVTRDIPGEEIWGGNPARFIKKR